MVVVHYTARLHRRMRVYNNSCAVEDKENNNIIISQRRGSEIFPSNEFPKRSHLYVNHLRLRT